MATFEIKNFDYENFYKKFNFDEYYEHLSEEELKQIFFDECCQNKIASHLYDIEASDLQCALERTVEKLREWHNTSKRYFYFKEKILGKRKRNEKKNNFYWLGTNGLYIENVQKVIECERDYWISAAEVSYRLCDKNGTPLFRETWVTSMPCHFLILDLEEAGISENLNLDFYLSGEQMTELVLEHCRNRGLPEPMIWGDHEELFVVWPLKVPYEKGRYGYKNNRGRLIINKFVFNLDWNEVQDLLYRDFKYLGANPTKKHALTMLRVPGTFNSHANATVRVFHDAEKTSLEEIEKALVYVRDRLKRYKPIRHPDFKAKLKEFQKENEEFFKFWNSIDGTETHSASINASLNKKNSPLPVIE